MTRGPKIVLLIVTLIVCVAGWYVYRFLFEVSHIHEAYEAWDTGTLLVEYMKRHDDHWPKSWDDLVSVIVADSDRQIRLRGASAGDVQYARSLHEMIAIDWNFDPTHVDPHRIVTQIGGGNFPVMWEDPNEMVWGYLKERASTQP